MRNRVFTIIIALAGITIASVLTFATKNETEDGDQKQKFKDNYTIYSLPLPDEVSFAGEVIPLSDPQVRENYDRELLVNTYWQSQTVLFIKRSARYFPTIEQILKEEGVPEDFKYLPLIESGLSHVVSPAGAVGFWQIMEGTAEDYGLEVNKAVDERYHLEKATRVACTYLKEAYAEFGTWTLAAASYNMGMNGLRKQLERQRGSSYFDLNLNSETMRYVYRLVAIKEILSDPQTFGFQVREKDRYQPIPTLKVKVDTALTHVDYLNQKFGINYRILKFHNPWLRMEYLPAREGKTYEIEVPLKESDRLSQPIDPPVVDPNSGAE